MKTLYSLLTILMLLATSETYAQNDNNWLKDFDGKVDGQGNRF